MSDGHRKNPADNSSHHSTQQAIRRNADLIQSTLVTEKYEQLFSAYIFNKRCHSKEYINSCRALVAFAFFPLSIPYSSFYFHCVCL